jgi:hypothetical protein
MFSGVLERHENKMGTKKNKASSILFSKKYDRQGEFSRVCCENIMEIFAKLFAINFRAKKQMSTFAEGFHRKRRKMSPICRTNEAFL